MKTVAVSSILFAGLALAVPAVQKRDLATQVVVTTVWTTTTQYVQPPSGNPNAFFEKGGQSPAAAVAAPTPAAAAAPSPAAAQPAPVAAPVQQQVAAPAPAPAAAAAAAPISGGGPSGTGEATWYDVSPAAGSCGKQASNNDNVVALSHSVMANGANPNANPLCGKTITITYNGAVHKGVVYDTCEGCAATAIDLSPTFFKTVFPNGDGRVGGVSWVVG